MRATNEDTPETTTQTLEDETLGPHMKPRWASEGPNMVRRFEDGPKIGSKSLLGSSGGAKTALRAILGALGDPFWGLENAGKRS